MLRPLILPLLFCAVSASPLLGCYATVSPEPVGVAAESDVVYEPPPAQVETYPTVVYEGRPHYYVQGRWYSRTSRGWGYYRHEPAHLSQHRPAPGYERHEEHRGERHEERHEEHEEHRR
jgi:hypothetical protein